MLTRLRYATTAAYWRGFWRGADREVARTRWTWFALAWASIILSLVSHCAGAAECLQNIKAVRAAHYPGVTVRWSHGCYYAIDRRSRHTASVLDRPRSWSPYELDTPQAAGAGRTLTDFDRRFLIVLTPQYKIDEAFTGMGWR
jgi:hypothetical protein